MTYKSLDSELLYRRVVVGLRKKRSVGFVISKHDSFDETPCPFTILEVLEKIDENAIVDGEDVSFAQWMEKYYFAPLGDVFALFFSFSDTIQKKLPQWAPPTDVDEKLLSLCLNEEQENAVNKMLAFWAKNPAKMAYLKGPTGSGKSFVFCSLIQKKIEEKRSVLLLVPEISIVLEMEKRFAAFLGQKKVSVFHSKVTAEQKNAFLAMKEKPALIIGTRSALFIAKWNNLGMIIVDEEHEEAYKNNATPRYHTRQVVQILAKRKNVPLLFASATPSVDLMYQCQKERIFLVELTKQYNIQNIPVIRVIPVECDKKREARDDQTLSEQSFQAMIDAVENKNQAIVYLNRRGFSAMVSCQSCGAYVKCPNCDISLTYHKKKREVLCHYCDYKKNDFVVEEKQIWGCPKCGERKGFVCFKSGVEKIYENIKNFFPNYSVERFDSDTLTTSKKMNELMKKSRDGEVDILVGTQMLAKGHDFSKAMMMVILYPENALNLPDYRSVERFFSSVTQAKGRVGRKLAGKSTVFIETFVPKDETLSLIVNNDQETFYRKEIDYRKEFLYPPFCKLCRFVVRDASKELGLKKSKKIADFFAANLKIFSENQKEEATAAEVPLMILGPTSCLFARVSGKYRFHVIIKIFQFSFFQQLMQKFKKEHKRSFFFSDKSFLEIDMDPVDLF